MEGQMPEDHYQKEVKRFDAETVVTMLPDSHNPNDFSIDLNPAKLFPRPSCPYHMNQEECAKCWKVLNEMLKAWWVEPANSNCLMAAQMFFIWKKDGTHRLVIDNWKLNKITIKDSYPLPYIDEMMDQIHGSNLGLYKAQSEIRLQPDPNPSWKWMEDHVHDSIQSIPTMGDDLWICKCTAMLPEYMNNVLGPVL